MEPTAETPIGIHPETLQEKPPEIVANLYDNVTTLLAANGWYLIFAAIAGAILWPRVSRVLNRWQKEREQKLDDAKRHKNPDLYETRQLAMEVARLRMQAEHTARAQVAAEQAAEKESLKRQEKLSRLGAQDGGNKLNTTSTNRESESLGRPQYNPLMGAGSAAGYRPTRRSCPGGGCG